MYFLKDSYRLLPIAGSSPDLVSEFAAWQLFKAPKGAFEAKFPSPPQSAFQNVRDPKTGQLRHYEMFISEKENGTIFMVNVINFPDYKESLEPLKKTIINDLLISNPQNELKSMEVGTYHLFPTIDFVIAGPQNTVNGRTFSDSAQIYLLAAIFNNSSYNIEEYNYFLNSFQWMSP